MALALLTHYFCIFLVGSAETDRRRVFFHLTCGLLLGIFGAIEMARKTPPLELSRSQILRFRRRVGSLDERLPAGTKSLRRAAWAGLQDSMPRAALLSIHARMEGADSTSWGAPVPRPALGSAIQRLRRGRRGPPSILPWAATGGRAAPRKGARHRCPPARVSRRQADAVWPSRARDGRVAQQPGYAAPTGTVLLRWDGSRQPVVWTVPPPDMDPWQARLELARRYLHVCGPTMPAMFAGWAGIGRAEASVAFQGLAGSLTPVRTPVGDAWILSDDEKGFRSQPGPVAPARLLPSGDAYSLLWEPIEKSFVPDPKRRAALWTTRVWPGAVLVGGEITGVWRRSAADVSIDLWRRLSRTEWAAVEAEALSLPLPGPITVR